jgi:hypothetical protein
MERFSADKKSRRKPEGSRGGHAKEIALLRTSRKRGTAPRLTFVRLVSNLLTEICGQPLDREAAFLTEIAFPGVEIDENLVRHARQSAT